MTKLQHLQSRPMQHSVTKQNQVDISATSHPGHILQRAMSDPGSLTPTDIQMLQRSVGNQATTRLLSPILQPKLKVGPVGDPYEQEADRVAQQVVSQTAHPQPVQRQSPEEEELQMKPLATTVTPVQRQSLEEEELQMKPLAATVTPVQRQSLEEEELQMKPLAATVTSVQHKSFRDGDVMQRKITMKGKGVARRTDGSLRQLEGEVNDSISRNDKMERLTDKTDISVSITNRNDENGKMLAREGKTARWESHKYRVEREKEFRSQL